MQRYATVRVPTSPSIKRIGNTITNQPYCTSYNNIIKYIPRTHYGPYAKKGAPSIKELLPKDSEELPKGTS